MPLQDVDTSVNLLRIKILTVVLSVLLAAGMFSVWQIEHIRRLTGQVRDFARDLAAGQTGKKLFLSRQGEFDEIAASLNIMSEELRSSLTCHEEEQHRLNLILRNIPDALFIIDRKGMITLSSVAARKLFGEIALKGKPFIEVVRNSEFLSLMETVRREERTGSVELRLDSPLEQYCVVQVSPLFYTERELSGFVAIFHDITQLKRLEQTRKDFVANISHEIRTPIAAIQGFADTLLQGALEDREHAAKFLGTIRANSQRINNLVEDLLTISKLELGAIRVEPSSVDIREAAGQVVALFREKAAARNIALQTRLLPEHRMVQADRDRLIQVLANLVDNALKFTDSGSVTIGSEHHNGRHCLFVEDTGIGVAPKHIPRLGERFYRVDPGRSRNMGGTGLGLAIVKHLVKAHGWDMQIDSTPNKGPKVRLLLEDGHSGAPG
jgi:two-component system phosphate regulon sensor histidine kinase PhoR